jgi:hypothetical protein
MKRWNGTNYLQIIVVLISLTLFKIYNHELSTTSNTPHPLLQNSLASLPPRHTSQSLTTYIWHNGVPFQPTQPRIPNNNRTFLIDILSISSHGTNSKMMGQLQSWASHSSVRYFFGATEDDDCGDVDCQNHLSMADVIALQKFCSFKMKYNNGPLRPIKDFFPRQKFMEAKSVGWLCAQQRFAYAIGKIGRFYRIEKKRLPDYFFLQDDDTWVGMNQMISYLPTVQSTLKPMVLAGCLVTWPLHMVNFTFPFGGYGTVMNKRALERLIQPIFCHSKDRSDSHSVQVCKQLQKNLAGEAIAFEDGMSVSDLMDKHAAMLPYKNFGNWTDGLGYCMLGDWIMGYYLNYYDIGSDGSDDKAINPFSKIDGRLGSIYKSEERSCLNTGINNCRLSNFKYFCHRLDADDMAIMQRYDNLRSTLAKSTIANFDRRAQSFKTGKVPNPLTLEPVTRKGDKCELRIINSTCRVLITHSKIDNQYYSLESIPLHHPLLWEEIGCKDRGLYSSDPIVFDYLYPFFGVAKVLTFKASEAYKWMKYFEEHLQGLIRTRVTDGRFIQFGSILGHKDQNSNTSNSYAAKIIASCDSNYAIQFKVIRAMKNVFCVLENPAIHVPGKLKAKACFLSPKNASDCWYLPTEFPTFSAPTSLSIQEGLKLCVPIPKSLDPLAEALNPWMSQILDIELYGPAELYRNSTRPPSSLLEHLTFREDFQSYISNHRALIRCHAMILLPPLFIMDDNNVTMNQFISQAIGHNIPIVIPLHHSRLYKEHLNTTQFVYDELSTTSLIKAINDMMMHFNQVKMNESLV